MVRALPLAGVERPVAVKSHYDPSVLGPGSPPTEHTVHVDTLVGVGLLGELVYDELGHRSDPTTVLAIGAFG